MSENLNNVIETEPKSTNAVEQEQVYVFRNSPISTAATSFLQGAGWIVAIIGIIAGIIILFTAPTGPDETTLKYSSDKLPVQIQQTIRTAYLFIGLATVISSIVAGTLLAMIASIGNAVLDIWSRQQIGKGKS